MSEIDFVTEAQTDDELLKLLGRRHADASSDKAKTDDVFSRKNAASDTNSFDKTQSNGYDLTNPNLHYGTRFQNDSSFSEVDDSSGRTPQHELAALKEVESPSLQPRAVFEAEPSAKGDSTDGLNVSRGYVNDDFISADEQVESRQAVDETAYVDSQISTKPVLSEKDMLDNDGSSFDAASSQQAPPTLSDSTRVVGPSQPGEPIAHAPVILSNGGGDNAAVSVEENSLFVTKVTATDLNASTSLTYTIVGGSDAALFAIDPVTGDLVFKSAPDRENPVDVGGDNIYDVIVQVSDGTHIDQQRLAINVSNVNEGPSDATLTNNSIAENSAAGTIVGTVAGVDPDAGATFTYSIVGGDSAKYQIDATTGAISLKAGVALDHESDASDSVTVRVTDQGGLTTDKTFAINVSNVNEGPTNATLTNNNIAENSAAGTVIGTVAGVDPDAGATFTYSIVGGDSAKYQIDATTGAISLKAGVALDYEADANDSVTVRVTDQGGLTTDKTFAINVSNVNEGPSDATLTNNAINENSAAGTVIGTVAGVDPDAGATFTYSIVGGDSAKYQIDATTGAISLKAGVALDHESDASDSVTVRVTDQGGLTTDKTFAINVSNVNEGPSDATLTNNNIAENSAAGTIVGTVAGVDPDAGATFTYSIVGGDSAKYQIDATTGAISLKAGVALDYEADATDSVTVRVTDQGGLTTDKTFAINVSNVNEGPSDATLTNNNIAENSAAGTIVGNVAGVDPDAGATFTYSIVGGDSAKYQIDATTGAISLKAGVALDHESDASDSVTVRVTDQGGLTTDKTFAINVSNVNEGPSDATLTNNNIAENSAAGTIVGNVAGVDPDAGATFTYSIVGGDSAKYQIDATTGAISLKAGVALDYEADANDSVTVRVTDQGGLTTDKTFAINVSNVNEGPSDATLTNNAINENSAAGTVIGTVAGVDPDAGATFTYSIVGGDSAKYQIDATTGAISLKAGVALDHESDASDSVTVRVTDQGGLTTDKTFAINVSNVNEGPSDATLTNNNIAENSAAGTIVGNVAGVDPDAGATFTYSIVGGDSAKYQIDATTGAISLKAGVALDYEADATDSVTVRVTDQGGLTTDKTFAINVSNVNEGPSDATLTNNAINENSAAGTVIGTVAGVDPDAGATFTYSIVGGDSAKYQIDATTGAISLKAGVALDYEADATDSVTVRVTDQGGLTTDKTFAINVSNVNEGPSDATLTNNSIAENSAAGTIVGTVAGVDPDAGATFTYSIVGGDSAKYQIDATTGAISLKAGVALDHESDASDSVTVRVTDQGGLTTDKTFAINVSNVNEGPSDATLTNNNIAENSAAGTVIGTVAGVDPDAGATFTYSIVGGDSAKYQIDATTGAISLKAGVALDYEADATDSVTVRVTDQGGLTTDKTFAINVSNVNEGPSDATLTNNNIAENSAAGTIVGNVAGVDPDAGATFTYSIVGGDSAKYQIDATTGAISLKAGVALDHESDASDSVTVRVTDQGGLTTDKTFAINVSNVNEGPSDATLTNNNIAENSAAGTIVGNVAGVDPDAGATFTYSIVGGDSAKYQIDATTGAISLKAGVALDYEADATDSVTVRVTDQGGLTTDKTFAINVSNVNEGPSDATLTNNAINENSAAGTVIGTVAGVDPDAGATFTYSIVGGDSAKYQIDATTGAISLKAGVALDHESDASDSVTVRVTDQGGLTTDKTFAINVSNVNEGPSDATLTNNNIAENSAAGTVIGTVAGVDPDAGATFTYSIVGGDSAKYQIDATTGAISLKAGVALDHESDASDSVTVRVTDQGGLTTDKTFAINVSNVNEGPTNATLTNNNIAENSAAGTVIGTVAGVDPDAGATFTYSIVGGDSAKYQIDATTGAISLKAGVALDYEADATDSVTVRVTDQGGLTTDKTFAINVSNVNEGPSDATLTNNAINENSAAGTVIGTVAGVDPDAGATFTYQIVGGDSAKYQIDATTGAISLKAGVALDHESDASDSVTVRVTDQGGLTTDKTFAINVSNVNEGPTNATLTNNNIAENSAAGTVIGTVAGVDPDAGATFTYQIVGGDSAKYQIDATTGAISLKAGVALDYEADANDSVTVRVTDQGGLTTDKTFAINVSNVNEGPSDATLTNNAINENSAAGTVIGTVAGVDPDAGATFTYSIVGGDSAKYQIDATTGAISLKAGVALDHESDASDSVTVRVTDQGGLTTDKTFAINVSNVNEGPSDATLTNNNIAENSAAGTIVGTVAGVDPDAGATFTYSIVGGDSAKYQIDATTGAISLKAGVALDYEADATDSVTVRVTDQGGLTTDKTFAINVSNVNEGPSDATLTNNNIAENSAAGTIVGNVAGVDPDAGATFTYSIVGGDSAKYQIDATTGAISLKAGVALDHESDASDSVTVRVTDQGGLTTDKTFAINVSNVNEGPSDATLTNNNIAENSAAGTIVGNVAGVDPDAGATFTYSIVGGDSAKYQIDATTGAISLKAGVALDYEADATDSVTVRVTDQGGLTTDKTFAINVSNVNEGPSDATLTNNAINENSAAGTVIGTVAGVDPDAGATFTYSIVGGDSAKYQIDATTGAISLKAGVALDYEADATDSVTVRVTDQGGLTTDKTFAINVSNVNEGPSDATLTNNSIAENSAAGTIVGTVAGVDPDAGATFTYSIVGGDSAKYQIDATTGAISLKAGVALDHESDASDSVTVRVTDQGGLTTDKTFAINVSNVNEGPSDATLTNNNIAENSAAGTVIGTVAGVDPDAGATFTYSIVGGDSAKYQIDATTGAISLKAGVALDYEADATDSVTVRVTDQGGLTTDKTFAINVSNVNEGPSDATLTNNNIAENSAAGTIVGNVAGVDPDAGATFTYSIVGGDSAKYQIDATTGAISLKAGVALDHESDASDSVTVRVTDQGGLTTDKTFAINVSNVNEGPSDATLTNNNIAENSAAGTIVGNVAGVDPDAGATFTYSIVGGDSAKYQIDATTGAISLKAGVALDYEADATDSVTVRVTDQGGLTTDKTFAINVSNVNEGPSDATLTNNAINENSAAGTVIGTVAGVDPDAGATFTYSIVGGDSAKYQIDATTGAISLKAGVALDHESDASDSVTVRVTDQGGLTTDKTFAINVSNVNEGPSDATLTNNNIAENSAAGTVIGTVAGVDPDAGATFTYSIVGGDSAKYQIDATTGAISLKAGVALDHESDASDSVTVRVTDQGGLTTDKTFAINVSNVNEGPTNATLTNNNIAENSAAGTVIGTVAGVDPDAGATFTYSIVGGDSAKYQIDATTGAISLKAGVALDYEADATDSVTVRVTDQGGLTTDKTFAINVSNVNEGPSDATLTNNAINENSAAGTVIGTVAGVDPDAGATFTYQIVGGDSAKYQIDATTGAISLKAGVALDYEADATDSVTVRVTDQGGLTTDKTFAINVSNVNEGPTNATLTNNNIAENSAAGTVIGTVAGVDPDAGATFTYQIVGGDSAKYQIDATTGAISLKAGVALDYEADANDSVTVRVTDQGGLTTDKTFAINVSNVNEGPSDATLTNNAINENSAAGTVIGTVAGVDPDAGATFTYSIVGGDSAKYQIDATTGAISLKAGVALDHESDASDSVTVRVTDQGGLTTDKTFAINVSNVNEGPSDATLTNNNIAENSAAGTIVGTVAGVDPDAGATFTYSIVGGDSAKYQIDATTGAISLKAGVALDHESDASDSVTVRVTDQGGLTTDKTFAINVSNVNEGPSDATLTNNAINENSAAGTIVGTVAGVDPDAGATFTYQIVGGDSAKYQIDATTGAISLKAGVALDHESDASDSVTVRVTDQGGLTTDKTFAINVSNVNEGPSDATLTNNNIAENSAAGTVIGTVAGVDPDAGATFTYQIVGGDSAKYQIDATTGAISLKAGVALDYEADATDSVTVRVTDQGGLTTDKTFAINVSNVNEGPTGISISNTTLREDVVSGGTIGITHTNANNAFASLSTSDPDSGETFTYSIVGGDSAKYEIVNGNQVQVKAGVSINYETDTTDSITVRVTDSAGHTVDQQFNLNISNFSGSHTGTSGADNIVGTSEEDTITGGAGNDIIDGGAGNDTINYSGTHSDYTFNLNANGTITVTDLRSGSPDGTDTISNFETAHFSNQDSSFIIGTTGSDTLNSTNANEVLVGGGGNDTFNASYGMDVFDGGAGTDTISYANMPYSMTIDLGSGLGYITGNIAGADRINNIENATGGSLDDILIGNSSANVLTGGDGNDTLTGDAGNNLIVNGSFETEVIASAGTQLFSTLTGWTAESGQIQIKADGYGSQYTESGNQFVDVDADAAFDRFYQDIQTTSGQSYQLSFDTLSRSTTAYTSQTIEVYWNGQLVDTFDPTSADWQTHTYTVTGTGGLDRLTFAEVSGDNDQIGIALDNVSLLSSSNDTLNGGAGNDVLVGGAGADTLSGGDGTDTADYSASSNGVTVNLGTNVNSDGDAQGDSLTGIENVTGSNNADTLTGDANANVIDGGAGNDKLNGGDGNDTLKGGVGNDTLTGGAGTDVAVYSGASTNYSLTLNTDGSVTIVDLRSGSPDGTDTLSGVETLRFSDGDFTLQTGTTAAETMTGTSGNDITLGGDGNDQFSGTAGNDILDGGTAWWDTIDYSSQTSNLSINLTTGTASGGTIGTDTLKNFEEVKSGSGSDTITGNATAATMIFAGAGTDSITTGSGDDYIEGQSGADTINGGAGNDWATYWSSTSGVTVNLGTNVNTGGDAQGDSLTNIENVWGSASNDTLTGNTGDNFLYGDAGNDTLNGGDGNDTLKGGAGADTLTGGAGTDTADYSGASSGVAIMLQASNSGGVGASSVYANTAAGGYLGDAQGDSYSGIENLTTTDYNDIVFGGTSSGTIQLGAGDDQFDQDENISQAVETIYAGDGNDFVAAGGGNDILFGDAGNDNLNGQWGNDTIDGGTGDDTIYGGTGSDVITGGAGNDTISGRSVNGSESDDGIDKAVYSGATTDYDFTFASGSSFTIADRRGSTPDGTDTLTAIEQLQFSDNTYTVKLGTSSGETLTGSGINDAIFGGSGNDTLIGGSGGNDLLVGGDGNDSIRVEGGADVLVGGTGTDVLDLWTSGDVTVNLVAGTVSGGGTDGTRISGFETVWGGDSNDTIIGTSAAESLYGYNGNDTIDGGGGNDYLDGEGGTDTVSFGTATTGVTASLATTSAQNTGIGTMTITNFENMTGSGYNDTLTGNWSNNTMSGGAGSDTIYAGSGIDTIIGGAGNDTLYGQGGSDIFTYYTGDGNDTIYGGTNSGSGSGWIDAIDLNSGTSTLGTYGVDWTVTLTNGSISSVDNTNHTLTLSNEAAGTIQLQDGSSISFSELERITWS